jgi:hypothetical protein
MAKPVPGPCVGGARYVSAQTAQGQEKSALSIANRDINLIVKRLAAKA